ncbi:hypothetical protein BCF11_0371 [Collimonas sp. PA-H2]|nr:hypothetical protein BCF11_0371 [Collimonas sp. PA-H2]
MIDIKLYRHFYRLILIPFSGAGDENIREGAVFSLK